MSGRTWMSMGLGVAMAAVACSGSGDDASGGWGKGGSGSQPGGGGGTMVLQDAAVGNGGNSSAAGSDGCADLAVKMTRQTPTVMLLIDQSLSMDNAFGNGTRWTVVRDALLAPNTGLVASLQNEIRFGLALYTSLNGFQNGGTCPLLVEVSCTLGNYDSINAAYAAAKPIDDTPTGESIVAVAGKLEAIQEPGPKYIALATDGAPDSCEVPDDQTSQDKVKAKQKSVAAAQQAFSKGIRTGVIAIGDGIGTDHLQDLANAGAGLPVGGADNAPFFLALDQGELIHAFEKVIAGARSCTFTLDGTVVSGAGPSGKVALDGKSLPYGDKDGWQLKSANEIELVGTSCEAIQTGDHDLSAVFPCGSVVLPK